MKFILKLIKENNWFNFPYLIFLMVSGLILSIFTKIEIHQAVNNFHNKGLDLFFKYITNLGDGLFVMIICILLLFKSFRFSFYFLLSYLSSGIVVQILKRVFFYDVLRPASVLNLYLVEGVKIKYSNSFPSGHAATAFAFFFGISLISKSNLLKFLSFFVALLIVYSRMYLSQHFLIDIYFGSIIGTSAAIIFFRFLFLKEKTWLNCSALTYLKRR